MGFNCVVGVGLLCIVGLFWFDYDVLRRDLLVSGCFVFVCFVSLHSLLLVLRALLVAVFVVVYIWLCLLFAFWGMGFVRFGGCVCC